MFPKESFAETGTSHRVGGSMAHARTERPEEILSALGDLDKALSDHTEWLKNWHLRILRSLDPTGDLVDDDELLKCHFLDWLESQTHSVLSEQMVLRDLWEVGATLREKARILLELVKEKEIIPADEYSHFMNTVLEFNALARHLQNETWNYLANIDPLTGIGNRKAMIRELDRERDRFLRSGRPCCVAIADIDHFKRVNDTHGHVVGDKVLVTISECLSKQLRLYDSVHRYGGEEFLFCLPDTDIRTAAGVADRLRRSVVTTSIPFQDTGVVSVTISFGVAQMDPHLTLEETIERADSALYRAKQGGRNRVEKA